jgi:hypothetical protein
MTSIRLRSLAAAWACVAACTVWVIGEPRRGLAPGALQPERDVSNVRFRGDCTLMNMKAGTTEVVASGLKIETTGARFEYVSGDLRIYQGLAEPRRLVATLTLTGAPAFELCEGNDDHRLLWSEDVNLGIYGDSTMILSPKAELRLRCRGAFRPEYEGRRDGELLLIDARGGLELYPQRHEAGYTVNEISLGKSDWVADYTLRPAQRMMIAAFPGRPFDWEKSFHTESIIVYGSMGKGVGNPYGEMPPDSVIRAMARNFNILIAFHHGLYEDGSPEPPWTIVNEPEFQRLVTTARTAGLRVAPYTSYFSWVRRRGNHEGYFDFVKTLIERFGVGGIYIDGMLFDYSESPLDDKIANWEMIRRLRQLLGPDRAIVFHGTHLATPPNPTPTAVMPNVDTYCDATFFGEGVPFTGVDDPYVRFQVRKYGISNTVACWMYYGTKGAPNGNLTWRQCVDAVVRMNGRDLCFSSVSVHEPPPNNRYIWGDGAGGRHDYYLQKLLPLRQAYLGGEVPPGY